MPFLCVVSTDMAHLVDSFGDIIPHFCVAWWLIGRVDAFRPKECGLESCSSRYIGTLGKSFTHSYLWRFGVKL